MTSRQKAVGPVRFVAVTRIFDTGDDATAAGKFNAWVVLFSSVEIIPSSLGYDQCATIPGNRTWNRNRRRPTRMDALITALPSDRQFDLTHAYWTLADIAGLDPDVGPVGSAA
jgi:hypothetical protein